MGVLWFVGSWEEFRREVSGGIKRVTHQSMDDLIMIGGMVSRGFSSFLQS